MRVRVRVQTAIFRENTRFYASFYFVLIFYGEPCPGSNDTHPPRKKQCGKARYETL